MTGIAAAFVLCAPAFAVDSGDIVVAAVKGEVRVTMNGAVREVRAGSVLELPASLRTGRDGSIDLKQGATSISVGPDTELEFPALEKRGAPVDRIVQPRGNAFYDIGKREGRKLRVETPYLVGVIKGTQFNVAAQPDATTISLFEGRLEVRASDDTDTVDLHAGEIASRRRGDKSIAVIKMNEKPTTTAPRSQNQGGGKSDDRAAMPVRGETRDDSLQDNLPPRAVVSVDGPAGDVTSRDVGQGANAGPVSVAVDTGAAQTNVSVDAGAADVAADVRANVDTGGGAASVDAGVSTSVDAGGGAVSVNVGVSTGVDAGGGAASVDVGVSTGVDVTPAASVDVGTSVSVDVGSNGVSVDVGAATDVGAGPITNSIDAAAGVDLGSGGVSVNVDTGVAAGVGDVAAVDTAVDLGANLGTGAVDVDTTVDVGADVAGVDAGVSAGVDVGAGAIDLGVTLGNVDVDLGVDLGLDDGNNGNGDDAGLTDTSNPGLAPVPPGTIVEDVGGLLDGLLRRPDRR